MSDIDRAALFVRQMRDGGSSPSQIVRALHEQGMQILDIKRTLEHAFELTVADTKVLNNYDLHVASGDAEFDKVIDQVLGRRIVPRS